MYIRVLYGSQTGTAAQLGQRIHREAIRNCCSGTSSQKPTVVCLSMDDWCAEFISQCTSANPQTLFNNEYWLFVCSTTGDGQEPDNMKRFWKSILRRDLPSTLLSNVRFAVFGLGDSSYPKFNHVGKKLFKRLLQLGAKSLIERGDGDDQHYLGYHGSLNPWLKKLWAVLRSQMSITHPPMPQWCLLSPLAVSDVQIVEGIESAKCNEEKHEKQTMARLLSTQRLTSESHFQDVRHLEFSVDKAIIEYQPGDVVKIWPRNDPQLVEELLEQQGWSGMAQSLVRVNQNGSVETLTLHEWLTLRLDIFSTPKDEYYFELLHHFATDSIEKERLKEFCTAEGQEDLYDYCYRARRTHFEVLMDFSSVRLPLKYLFDLFPPIRPREFSISNYFNRCLNDDSNSADSGTIISITVGIVRYQTVIKKPRVGLCTSYLAQLKQNDLVQLQFKSGTMALPQNNSISSHGQHPPIILISPGLGVAPMRSIIHKYANADNIDVYLFRGCRYEDHDCLFKREFESICSQGRLKVFNAFSRDEPRHKRQYVQDVLLEQRELVRNLVLERGAFMYLCGDSKQVPLDVQDVLERILSTGEGNSGKDIVERMKKERRFQLETW